MNYEIPMEVAWVFFWSQLHTWAFVFCKFLYYCYYYYYYAFSGNCAQEHGRCIKMGRGVNGRDGMGRHGRDRNGAV